eukprot:CAMPEP_0172497288 /NCGR_PEP_ID=MMETSP1066-20121228/97654_1 /TAXON_ID=671091 /ORGANISM="Coscinodiscus wailesii, Strain CCMP2513" /LENGTH=200 /DNA_ID=CAMNT_0013269957 /DNA_START=72 /DNA_END=674 /DNA_ORIENTATION=+
MSSPPWASVSTETTPQVDYSEEEQLRRNTKGAQIGGVAAAAGVTGLIVSGPLLGVAAAGGAAYVAAGNSGAGDTARGIGDAVVEGGRKAKEYDEEHHVVGRTMQVFGRVASVTARKAQEIDEEYHVVDRTKEAGVVAAQRAKEIDEEHGVWEKTKSATFATGRAIRDFDQRHRVVEKTGRGIANASYWLASKLRGDDKKP